MTEIRGQGSLFGSRPVGPEGMPKEEAEAHRQAHHERLRADQRARAAAHDKVKNTKHMIEQEPAPNAVQTRARMLGAHNYDNVPKRITGVFRDRRVN